MRHPGRGKQLQTFIVAGERRIEVPDKTRHLAISPDGRRVAYTALLNGRAVVVLDDRAVEMDDVAVQQLHFSSDGRRLGCLVSRDREIYWREIR